MEIKSTQVKMASPVSASLPMTDELEQESADKVYSLDEMKDWLKSVMVVLFGHFRLTPDRENSLLTYKHELSAFCKKEMQATIFIRNHSLIYDKTGLYS